MPETITNQTTTTAQQELAEPQITEQLAAEATEMPNVQGLKTALEKERQANKQYKKQLAEYKRQAEGRPLATSTIEEPESYIAPSQIGSEQDAVNKVYEKELASLKEAHQYLIQRETR